MESHLAVGIARVCISWPTDVERIGEMRDVKHRLLLGKQHARLSTSARARAAPGAGRRKLRVTLPGWWYKRHTIPGTTCR